ncbi:hypothetical protein CPAV1605_1371 [seawater metagenome]|uniref:Uncharacterized protein n=1 Tax=seawater metagenome TaxID=1561972 RepID=A0A5E8CL83_9ZZZZ
MKKENLKNDIDKYINVRGLNDVTNNESNILLWNQRRKEDKNKVKVSKEISERITRIDLETPYSIKLFINENYSKFPLKPKQKPKLKKKKNSGIVRKRRKKKIE